MRHLFKAALFAATSLAIAPASAEDLVVTATRTPAPLERLPARVDMIDRASIEARAIVTLPEAIGAAAVQSGGAGQQTSAFLRGASSKHALALFDGVRLNDASTPNGQYDFGLDTLGGLDRVEVLRGPASAVYGSDAVGGVVNLIPRSGAATAFAPFAEAAHGAFDTSRVLAGAAGTAGALSYGLSGEWFDTEGYDLVPRRMATHTGDADGARITTLTAAASAQTGAFTFDLLGRWRESRTAFDTFSGGPFFDLRADDPNLQNEATQSLWRLGAAAALSQALIARLSGGQVRSDRSESDGGVQTSAAESGRDFADLSLNYTHGAATLTGGLAFERNSIDTTPPFANPLSAGEEQLGAYLIGQFALSENITATAALRGDDYETFGTHTTYSLGVVADLAPLRLYASYGTAFKAPSLSERFETSFFNIGNPDLRPEESHSWEVGADVRLIETWRVGASYYQTRIDDLIDYSFAALRNINVGEAAIDGAEAYVALAPASWADVRVAYAWTDAANAVTGQPLARRPEHSWRFDLALAPVEQLTLALTWTYVGERNDVTYSDAGVFSSANGLVDSFSIGAIAATYHVTDHADLFVRVDNVTDETYEQPAAFAGTPRAWTIGVRARY
ncbi:MAG: TonB-dependent receptor [Hyphomonadaceae bacterium]|nr:TonB-dependent receptor [Hyphomonadaceae bacterium]MBX3511910.1 TonB-dependent receptor [Hyphomonadaceae bacterium]